MLKKFEDPFKIVGIFCAITFVLFGIFFCNKYNNSIQQEKSELLEKYLEDADDRHSINSQSEENRYKDDIIDQNSSIGAI